MKPQGGHPKSLSSAGLSYTLLKMMALPFASTTLNLIPVAKKARLLKARRIDME
tara:strand:- start:191 stop:352 length:162 start_codon:yes stop_codon:yes gene_type:complete